MNDRENLETVEGDAASIIRNPPRRERPVSKPETPPPVQQDTEDLEIEKPLSPAQKKRKLEGLIAAAMTMSRNKGFPKDVRDRFLEKAAKYTEELSAL